MVEESLEAYLQPDLGIWEYRDQPRVHLFSQAMCWAAVHHGAVLAGRMERHARAEGWRARADEMREVILDRGFDPSLGMFVQAFGEGNPDAANLLLPSIGIVDARDGRFRSTIERYRKLLVRDHGVMRYLHSDDFGEPTSTFTVCSFWWCEALAQAGEVEEARERFHALLAGRIRWGSSARTSMRSPGSSRQLPAGLHPHRSDPRGPHDRRGSARRGRGPRLDLREHGAATCPAARRRVRF